MLCEPKWNEKAHAVVTVVVVFYVNATISKQVRTIEMVQNPTFDIIGEVHDGQLVRFGSSDHCSFLMSPQEKTSRRTSEKKNRRPFNACLFFWS